MHKVKLISEETTWVDFDGIWVSAVLRGAVVCGWPFDSLNRSCLQSWVRKMLSGDHIKYSSLWTDWSANITPCFRSSISFEAGVGKPLFPLLSPLHFLGMYSIKFSASWIKVTSGRQGREVIEYWMRILSVALKDRLFLRSTNISRNPWRSEKQRFGIKWTWSLSTPLSYPI